MRKFEGSVIFDNYVLKYNSRGTREIRKRYVFLTMFLRKFERIERFCHVRVCKNILFHAAHVRMCARMLRKPNFGEPF